MTENMPTAPPTHPEMVQYNLARNVADRAFRILDKQLKLHEKNRGSHLFYAWPRQDRAILIFDPASFKDPRALLEPRFAERLEAGLGNRRVVVTLHGALFIQISYTPGKPALRSLAPTPLDLGAQPGPHHVPLGTTAKGPLWLSLLEMDSVLIGGARRMGKTRLLHGFIQGLLRGAQAELLLWDGKNGVEFGRYRGQPRTQVVTVDGLAPALTKLTGEMVRRQGLFQQIGAASLEAYNDLAGRPLPILVPIIDELALVPEAIQTTLAKLIALGGAFGIHPIVATQRPDAAHIQGLLKSNLATRISLPVPDHTTAKIILGRTGAEKLPKTRGRMLMVWEARPLEVQAFHIELTAAAGRGIPQISLLTAAEFTLVKTAAEETGGWFKIRELADRTGQGRDAVNILARQWEKLGYLTPVQRNPAGHQLGRRVTPQLLQAAGLDGSGDRADWADETFLAGSGSQARRTHGRTAPGQSERGA